MTIAEWQAKPGCITSANEVLRNPVFLDMLSVLESAHPAKQAHIRNMTSQDLLVEHGFIKGFTQCIEMLKSLGELKPEFKEPVSYFAETTNE